MIARIGGVRVETQKPELQKFAERLVEQVKRRYSLESLKDLPIFRAYRDFFWRIGIDPTKNRPAAEALIRRVLANKPFPKINTLVDAYNLASVKTGIALAAFDSSKIRGDLVMRFANKGERFLGIGMKKPIELEGGEVVISDAEKLVAIYPYRDSDQTKVTEITSDILLLICGVPGIEEEILLNARREVTEIITEFCGGEVELS